MESAQCHSVVEGPVPCQQETFGTFLQKDNRMKISTAWSLFPMFCNQLLCSLDVCCGRPDSVGELSRSETATGAGRGSDTDTPTPTAQKRAIFAQLHANIRASSP